MAGRIPPNFIDELLNRTDIVEVIDKYVGLKKAGRDYKALCPFHNEKTPSFTVSQVKQFYYCFGCGASGSALGFLMDYAHLDFVEAVEELAGRAGLQVPHEISAAEDTPDLTPVYDQLAAAQRFFARQLRQHPAAERAVDYLKERGLSGEVAADFGLGYAPPGWDNLTKALGFDEDSLAVLLQAGLVIRGDKGCYDRFRDRVMFPIHDTRGRVIGFGGRIIDQGEPKYLNSPETPVFHKGKELYGLYQARRSRTDLDRMLVVEGYMDVVALAQFGIKNVVATLGTATTREHLERLFRFSSEIVFCFDGDAAGRRAAWRALEQTLPLMREGRYVGFQFMPAGADPDSLVRAEGVAAFRNPDAVTPLSVFLFDHLSAGADTTSLDGRARLAEQAKPLLGKVPEGPFRRLLLRRLAELTGLEAEDIGNMAQAAPGPGRDRRANTARMRQAPSLVRTAIALLLHYPRLALEVADPAALGRLQQPGIALLVEILEFVQSRPDINGGALVEHWRGTAHGQHLAKLIAWELPVPEQGAEAEFRAAIARLQDRARRAAERAALPRATRPSEMSESEKAAIRTALGGNLSPQKKS